MKSKATEVTENTERRKSQYALCFFSVFSVSSVALSHLCSSVFICGFVLSLLLGVTQEAQAEIPKDLVESRRDCATCHLEWSADFEKPGSILLIDKPLKAMSSDESTCLGCHDGAVGDSRKKVWREH